MFELFFEMIIFLIKKKCMVNLVYLMAYTYTII